MASILKTVTSSEYLDTVDTELLLDVHHELDKRIDACQAVLDSWMTGLGNALYINRHNHSVYTLMRIYVKAALVGRGLTMMDKL